MPEPLFLLHLSDLHFGKGSRFDGRDFMQLARDCSKTVMKSAPEVGADGTPDAVIVTGDLTQAAKPSEFEQVGTFLGALADGLELDRRHFFFCPGNHDVSWPACKTVMNQLEDEEFPEEELRQRLDGAKLARFAGFARAFSGVDSPEGAGTPVIFHAHAPT